VEGEWRDLLVDDLDDAEFTLNCPFKAMLIPNDCPFIYLEGERRHLVVHDLDEAEGDHEEDQHLPVHRCSQEDVRVQILGGGGGGGGEDQTMKGAVARVILVLFF
jgi:hypothetical protein